MQSEIKLSIHHIVTEAAPWFQVMDLQTLHGTAHLTPPTIAFQYLDSEYLVFFRFQFEPGLLLS
jgi:hypothetical protein